MTEERKIAVRKVINAWINPGPVPFYHVLMKQKLKKEWPVLHDAIIALIKSKGDDSR
jgi:hypothetical protein